MELHWVGGREASVSWREMWLQMYPTRWDRLSAVEEPPDSPSGDGDAHDMQRLRGIAVVQAAETEAVLGEILSKLDPEAERARPAGALLVAVRRQLDVRTSTEWANELDSIREAIKRRNMLVHNTVSIDYTWTEYATGDGGEHIPVTSHLGSELYDEEDLREDIEMQRSATLRAVKLLHHVAHREGVSPDASYCTTCLHATGRL
jgi:hypothetical protein